MAADGSGLVRFLWDERPMTETHAVLWVVIVIATVTDMLLTMAGLGLGLQEGNVVVRTMLAAFGPAGLWLVKFAAMCWLVAGWALLEERHATVFLGLFAVVTLAVSGYNAALIVDSGLL